MDQASIHLNRVLIQMDQLFVHPNETFSYVNEPFNRPFGELVQKDHSLRRVVGERICLND